MKKLGVCIVGVNGAVASTLVAGVELMKQGLVPRNGMLTESGLLGDADLVDLENLEFGGWCLTDSNMYEAACKHEVVPRHLLDKIQDKLEAIRPWKAVASEKYLFSMAGDNRGKAESTRQEIARIEQDLRGFMDARGLERVVVVNLASTEKFFEMDDMHRSLPAFEKALDDNDPRVSPSMKYFYTACKMGLGHVNFTPSLTTVPALAQLAEDMGSPVAGDDGKTGQTFVKTVLAPAFAMRDLKVEGWFSTNILGNNDGLVLNDPESNKTKVVSKQKVLDSMLGYEVPNHQVHIHYYKPRGDAKEAWDNIDLSGFLGERMQFKIDFLCKDSILAAPLVLDLVRLVDLAKRRGDAGIQRQLSMFFKAPLHEEGEIPLHDFFKQTEMLMDWVKNGEEAPRAFTMTPQLKATQQPTAHA